MTRQEFIDSVNDVGSLYDFCTENYQYESYVEDLYSSDSYDSYIDEVIVDRARNLTWRELRDELNDYGDPHSCDWWVLDAWGDFTEADNDWFSEKFDDLIVELDNDGFFDEEEEDDDDDDGYDFEVESTSVFVATA